MAALLRVGLGAAVAGGGFLALRAAVWERADRTVHAFQQVQSEIPGSHVVPAAPVPEIAFFRRGPVQERALASARSMWNYFIVETRSAVVSLTADERKK